MSFVVFGSTDEKMSRKKKRECAIYRPACFAAGKKAMQQGSKWQQKEGISLFPFLPSQAS